MDDKAQNTPLTVVMLGASGAVGGEAVTALLTMPQLARLTLMNRRRIDVPAHPAMTQHIADPLDPASYVQVLAGHRAAICTLGVGQPTKVSKEELVRVDKGGALAFGQACKASGIGHFALLSSVAADARSSSHYLRTKGELADGLEALGFERLSIFMPSMILTPTNRYDWKQAVMLAVWPALSPLLAGPLAKYRGIRVETLGRAMAMNLARVGAGRVHLHWNEINTLGAIDGH